MATITFNEIPQSNSLLPRVAAEVRPVYSNAGVFDFPGRVLLFVPKIAAGTAAGGTLFRITRQADVTLRCGAGSAGEDMAADFMAANTASELWGVVVAEPGGGTAGTGAFVFTAAPTGAGTIVRRVGGRRVAINVTASDTITTIAKALRDAINALPNTPVVASWLVGATGTCTLTAKHASTLGNELTLLGPVEPDEADPPGLASSITAMSGGAGALDLTTALAAVTSEWHPYWVLPVTDSTNLALVKTELSRRYAATGHQDAQAFAAKNGTLSALTTFGTSTANHELLATLGSMADTGAVTVEPSWRIASMLAAQASYALAQDPARQLKTLPLKGMRRPVGTRFIDSERELLLAAGISTYDVGPDGTCFLERVVSTRTTDATGVATGAWRDIMTAAVMSRCRYDFRTYWQLNYPRHKLAPDGSPAADGADNVMTPKGALGVLATRMRTWERLGWITDVDATLPLCIAQFPPDGTRNRLQMKVVLRVIDNLMQTDIAFEFQA